MIFVASTLYSIYAFKDVSLKEQGKDHQFMALILNQFIDNLPYKTSLITTPTHTGNRFEKSPTYSPHTIWGQGAAGGLAVWGARRGAVSSQPGRDVLVANRRARETAGGPQRVKNPLVNPKHFGLQLL